MNQRQAQTGPNINVTPLIDVLLVLLIIFMVISPLKPSRFEAKIPDKPERDTTEGCELCLVVTVEQSSYRLNAAAAASLNELEALLHSALDGRPLDRKATFIKAPRGLQYGEVVKVIDVMAAAGCAPIGLQLDGLD
jgi:biopolymer transport protein ExbD